MPNRMKKSCPLKQVKQFKAAWVIRHKRHKSLIDKEREGTRLCHVWLMCLFVHQLLFFPVTTLSSCKSANLNFTCLSSIRAHMFGHSSLKSWNFITCFPHFFPSGHARTSQFENHWPKSCLKALSTLQGIKVWWNRYVFIGLKDVKYIDSQNI